MKNILKKTFIILLALCSLSSCDEQSNNKKENQGNMKNLTLIYSVSGGTRAHIITINSRNELCYKVGSIFVGDNLDSSKITYSNNYKEIKKTLSDVNIKKINEFYSNKNSLLFNDSNIVKDSWEYYLYVDGKKMAFGWRSNFDDFPKTLKELINYIIGITGKLYDIPEMS